MRTLNRIEIKNFGNHKDTVIRLAPNGLYVFTGANGAGKSTIVDAIVWVLYKRFIRAKSGWNPITSKTDVFLHIDDITLWRDSRLYLKDEKSLRVGKNANDRCLELFGTYKDFMRSFILHKRYVSRFSMATDLEKKNILESILGFDLLDNAHNKVKSITKELLDNYNKLSLDEKSLSFDIKSLERSIEDIDVLFQFSYYSKKLIDLQDKAKHFEHISKPLPPDPSQKESTKKTLFDNDHYYNYTINEKIEALKRSLTNNKCAFCGGVSFDAEYLTTRLQTSTQQLNIYHNDIRPQLQDAYDSALNKYNSERIKYEEDLNKYEKNKEEYKDLINKIHILNSNINNKLEASKRITLLSNELYDKKQKYEIISYNLNILSNRLDRCNTYKNIYGNTGLRFKLLSDAISIIEDNVSKIYNNLIYGHIEHLTSCKPVLRVKDNSIFLGINNNGKITPYVGLSEGEKGLLDIAVLKSLYYLSPKQVLFPVVYDDIFDTFDDDITEKLIGFVCNEAETKPVFLITHNNKLLDIINRYTDNIKHYHVSNGCIGYGNS